MAASRRLVTVLKAMKHQKNIFHTLVVRLYAESAFVPSSYPRAKTYNSLIKRRLMEIFRKMVENSSGKRHIRKSLTQYTARSTSRVS